MEVAETIVGITMFIMAIVSFCIFGYEIDKRDKKIRKIEREEYKKEIAEEVYKRIYNMEDK